MANLAGKTLFITGASRGIALRAACDGHVAFVRSPGLAAVELLQNGNLAPAEPWASMSNTGEW